MNDEVLVHSRGPYARRERERARLPILPAATYVPHRAGWLPA